VHIQQNVELAPLTTFGIGGPAKWFVDAETESDVIEAANWARAQDVPLFVMGGGSNLLVSDAGFDGLVLHVAIRGVEMRRSAQQAECIFRGAAGENWDGVVQRTIDENCAGIECLAGIPGDVGGTPVQNVGAYGQEVASTVVRVRCYDLRSGETVEMNAAECSFGYRRSRFNTSDKGRYVILAVEYVLTHGGRPSLKYADLQREFPAGSNPSLGQIADVVRRIRQAKGMLISEGDPDCRSAGSFFKNPVVGKEQAASIARIGGSEVPQFPAAPDQPGHVKISAAWLIAKAGFARGYQLGSAGISTKHTLALVNLGGATASEILALADQIHSAVLDQFSIDLQMEPVMLGF
jgi:UDP-N-acetylmuramate dehydrogenase